MAQTKNDLLGSFGVTNQEALVKFLQKPKIAQSVKRIIPGGKTLIAQIDKDRMATAIYNWLRSTRSFSSFTISFAKEPELYRLKSTKVQEFDASDPKEIWETHPEGRKFLAKALADVVNKTKVVKVVVQKDGIYAFTDLENKFQAFRKVTKEEVDELKAAVDSARAQATAAGKAFTEPVLPNVGDEVPAKDWEPYIEFTPKEKPEYGH